jgi:hypothetical protein
LRTPRGELLVVLLGERADLCVMKDGVEAIGDEAFHFNDTDAVLSENAFRGIANTGYENGMAVWDGEIEEG